MGARLRRPRPERQRRRRPDRQLSQPQLATIVTAGSLGGTGKYVGITIDGKGRVVGASDGFITPASIGAAPLDSPAFTGVPTAPNPSPVHNNDQTLATTKFVKDAVAATVGGSIPTGNAGGDLDPVSTYPAPLIKPDVILRGNPTLQTSPPVGDNDLSIASTKFVKDQAYQTVAGMPSSLPPSGAAGGGLAGSYPNPLIKPSAVDGQVLTTLAGVAAWAAPATSPGGDFHANNSANIPIGAAAVVVILNTVLTGNSGGWYSTTTGRYTPPAGRYYISFTGGLLGSSGGPTQTQVTLRKNGANVAAGGQTPGAANWWGDPEAHGVFDANGTDYFDVVVSGNQAATVITAGTAVFLAFPLSGIRGQQGAAGPANPSNVLRNYFTGFVHSNAGGSATLAIGAGVAADSTNAVWINGTPISKSLSATWAAGSGAGGMGPGVTLAPSTWYFPFAAIINGAYDVFFDTTAVPTHIPANTTAYRRLRPVPVNASSTIFPHVGHGDEFSFVAPPLDLNGFPGTVPTLVGLTVPPGINVDWLGNIYLATPAASGQSINVWLYDPATGVAGAAAAIGVGGTATSAALAVQVRAWTNTAQQIGYSHSGVGATLNMYTRGFIDSCGRLD